MDGLNRSKIGPIQLSIIMSKKVFIRPIGVVKCFIFLIKNMVNHGVVGKRANRNVPKSKNRAARLPTLQVLPAPFI